MFIHVNGGILKGCSLRLVLYTNTADHRSLSLLLIWQKCKVWPFSSAGRKDMLELSLDINKFILCTKGHLDACKAQLRAGSTVQFYDTHQL